MNESPCLLGHSFLSQDIIIAKQKQEARRAWTSYISLSLYKSSNYIDTYGLSSIPFYSLILSRYPSCWLRGGEMGDKIVVEGRGKRGGLVGATRAILVFRSSLSKLLMSATLPIIPISPIGAPLHHRRMLLWHYFSTSLCRRVHKTACMV